MANTRESTIFVGGLDNHVTTETLHDAFIPFGEIVDVSLPKPDMASNKDPHRGFGYVEFGSAEDAREAINNMDQSELYGKVIKVNPARPQKDPQEKLGSRTAVWEQACLAFYICPIIAFANHWHRKVMRASTMSVRRIAWWRMGLGRQPRIPWEVWLGVMWRVRSCSEIK